MKKYLYDYIKEIDEKLKDEKIDNKDLVNTHLIKIQFFQQERLIHLIVTLSFVLFMMIFFALSLIIHPILIIIFFILIIFLIFYVVHYFRLENGVQYLYKQYDIMMKKVKK